MPPGVVADLSRRRNFGHADGRDTPSRDVGCRAGVRFGVPAVLLNQPVDLASHIAFEAADDLPPCLALHHASLVVRLSPRVPAQPTQHDAVQCSVRLPVPAAIEPAMLPVPGRVLHRARSAQRGKRRFTTQAVAVVTHGGQQHRCAVRPNAHGVDQPGMMTPDQVRQSAFQHSGLGPQLLDALGQHT